MPRVLVALVLLACVWGPELIAPVSGAASASLMPPVFTSVQSDSVGTVPTVSPTSLADWERRSASSAPATADTSPAVATPPGPSPTVVKEQLISLYVAPSVVTGVHLRTGSDTAHNVILTLPYAARVQAATTLVRNSRGEAWRQVVYQGKAGFVLASLLSEQQPKPPAQPTPAPPVRLIIDTPSVHVDAPIEWVGLTSDQAMGVPRRWDDVAWYELGPRPGQEGDAVIDGHLDSTTGPAVFWDLKYLRMGDIISVVDTQGKVIRFSVRRIAVYYYSDLPMDEIFGPATGAHLNLITCTGYFYRNGGGYDRRLVVYTDKVSG